MNPGWEHLREKYFRNGYRLTKAELETDLSNALLEVAKETKIIQKLVGFHRAII